jgi:hypothetical protein
MSERLDLDFLADILEAIRRADEYNELPELGSLLAKILEQED